MKQKVLFIDRDGTLIFEPTDNFQVDSLEKLSFIPGVFTWLGRIARELDYELVIITNQDGLGTASFPEEQFWPAQNKMLEIFKGESIHFKESLIDKTFAHEGKPTRKPGTGLLTNYLNNSNYDLPRSFVVGDRLTDIQLAKNISAKGILLGRSLDTTDDDKLDNDGLKEVVALQCDSWEAIYQFLKQPHRIAIVERKTKETAITVTLNLDGTGQCDISTGLGFFDHMLEQLGRHSGTDLSVQVSGDLHIDEHHTIEDTALALGEAFAKALGDKRGIERYGFLLPMDDVLAQAAIDFSGRPWLVWEADFIREKVGDMPTEMFMHFFKSFSDAAKCNLNIKAEGQNEHHKIEAIFKAVAKAIRMAIQRSGDDRIPSTKGVL
jgi:imidazoleglycerol-phosphate dehydratase / histidinol-phosphatase